MAKELPVTDKELIDLFGADDETTPVNGSLDALPKDVLALITNSQNLTVGDFDSMAKTNKALRMAIRRPEFWVAYLDRKYPDSRSLSWVSKIKPPPTREPLTSKRQAKTGQAVDWSLDPKFVAIAMELVNEHAVNGRYAYMVANDGSTVYFTIIDTTVFIGFVNVEPGSIDRVGPESLESVLPVVTPLNDTTYRYDDRPMDGDYATDLMRKLSLGPAIRDWMALFVYRLLRDGYAFSDENGRLVRERLPTHAETVAGIFSSARSPVARLPESKLKEAYDTWATSYDGIVLSWMEQFVRARHYGSPGVSLDRYLGAQNFRKPAEWDPNTAEAILGDFGVDIKPSRFTRTVYLSDDDAYYLSRTLQRLSATRQVEGALAKTLVETGSATQEEIDRVLTAETAKDHIEHMGDEALKAVEERDALRAQNKILSDALERCRREVTNYHPKIKRFEQDLADYNTRMERDFSRVTPAPVQMTAPPSPPPPPMVPSAPPPPPPPPAGAPTAQSIKSAAAAAAQTLSKNLPSDLKNAITGFDPSALRKARPAATGPSNMTSEDAPSGNPLMDALRSRLASRRKGIAGTGRQIDAVLDHLESGKLTVNHKLQIIAADPCAVCEQISAGACACGQVRYCGQQCLSSHWESGHKDVCGTRPKK